MSNQLVAETSTWQHTTVTRDRHPCPLWDSNPQCQQASSPKPLPFTARPLGLSFSWLSKWEYVGACSPICVASHQGKLESLSTPLWEPEI